MKNIFKNIFKILIVTAGCLWFASFSPSLDGRAVVVDGGVFPQGLFAKTVGYLPGDIISVTNIAGDKTVDLLVIGALDPSEGVAIMLSPEAADAIGIDKTSNNIVKITKRSGQDERVYGNAVISKGTADNDDFDDGSFETIGAEENSDAFAEPELAKAEPEPVEEPAVEETPAPVIEETITPVTEESTAPVVTAVPEEIPEETEEPEQPEILPLEEEAFEEEPFEEENIEEEAFDEPEPEALEAPVEDAAEAFEDEPLEEPEEPEEPEETVEAPVEAPAEDYSDLEEEGVPAEEFVEEELPEAPAPAADEEEFADEELPEAPAEEFDEEEFAEEEAPAEEFAEDTEVPAEEFDEELPAETAFDEDVPAEEFVEDKPEELPEEAPAEEFVADTPEDLPEDIPAEEYSEELPAPVEVEEYEAIVLVPADSNPPEPSASVESVDETIDEAIDETVVEAAVDTVVDEDEVEDLISNEVEDIEEAITLVPETVEEAPVEIEKPQPAKTYNGSYDKYVVPSLKSLQSGKYYIQIAVYAKDENINEIIEKYGTNYPITIVPMAGGTSKQILIGPLSMDEYKVVLERFKSYGFKDAFLRKIK